MTSHGNRTLGMICRRSTSSILLRRGLRPSLSKILLRTASKGRPLATAASPVISPGYTVSSLTSTNSGQNAFGWCTGLSRLPIQTPLL